MEGPVWGCPEATFRRGSSGNKSWQPGQVADPQEAVSGSCSLSPGASTEPPLLWLYTRSKPPVLVLFHVFQVKVRGRSGAAKFLGLQGVSGASSGQRGRLSAALSWQQSRQVSSPLGTDCTWGSHGWGAALGVSRDLRALASLYWLLFPTWA